MKKTSSAMAVGEGNTDYKTDVGLILGENRTVRDYVLRTSLDSLSDWKAKHTDVGTSPFDEIIETVRKEAAMIDDEIWVFGIDSTKSDDIVTAVRIAMKRFNVKADAFLSNIYAKNLNIEGEERFKSPNKNITGRNEKLIAANRQLYAGVCSAIRDAAQKLGVKGELQIRVISHNKNPKITAGELHDALKDGGADEVITDAKKHTYVTGHNDGRSKIQLDTNLHIATLKV